jgi:hypothetical protein
MVDQNFKSNNIGGSMKPIIWNSFILITSIILFISSIFHRLLLDSAVYTDSFLIHIEILTFTLLIIIHLSNIFIMISLLTKKKMKLFFYSFIIAGISIILVFTSMIIDSPTLVFMT